MYIESKGGKVTLVSSLASTGTQQTGFGGKLALQPDTRDAIKNKFNPRKLNSLLSQYGIAQRYTDLTNSQAKYLLTFGGLDRIRTAFDDAGLRRISEGTGNRTDRPGRNRIKFQQLSGEEAPKGAVETLNDGRVVIHALTAPDFSTMVHEIAHVFEKDLTPQEQTKFCEKYF